MHSQMLAINDVLRPEWSTFGTCSFCAPLYSSPIYGQSMWRSDILCLPIGRILDGWTLDGFREDAVLQTLQMKRIDDKPMHAIVRRSSCGTSECKEVAQWVMGDTGRGPDCFVQCKVLWRRLPREEAKWRYVVLCLDIEIPQLRCCKSNGGDRERPDTFPVKTFHQCCSKVKACSPELGPPHHLSRWLRGTTEITMEVH